MRLVASFAPTVSVTPEAFHEVYEKEIAGFGELFRWLSYDKVGTSTIQSRATAGGAGLRFNTRIPPGRGARAISG